MEHKEMVEKFQCPGCVAGSDTGCGIYKFDADEMKCSSHVLGTIISRVGSIALGLPKGFCRPGFGKNKIDVRLWTTGTQPAWDHLNVPVWAMEQDGFLFVRTFAPRINMTWVDVIEGGNIQALPSVINVAAFIEDID